MIFIFNLVKIHNPDVSVRNSVTVILKHKRTASNSLVIGDTAGSNVRKLNVIVNYDTVLDNGNSAVLANFVALVEARSTENYIVCLPLKGRKTSVAKRSMYLINTGTIVVLRILYAVGVKNLALIAAVDVNAAVASALTGSFRHIGDSELNVNVSITKLIVGDNIAVTNGEDTVFHLPVGFLAGATGGPLIKIRTVKEIYLFFIHGNNILSFSKMDLLYYTTYKFKNQVESK